MPGEFSACCSDSASGVSGNQKSRSCQSAMLRATSSRPSDPSINFPLFGFNERRGRVVSASKGLIRVGCEGIYFNV